MKAELKAGNEDPPEPEPSRRQENEQQRIASGTSVSDSSEPYLCETECGKREA